MGPFFYDFFCKTTYGWNHQINCLLFTEHYQSPKATIIATIYKAKVRIWYDISFGNKKIVMKVTYEYMMTSSDQILWIFSRFIDPIYTVKLILIMLTYILLLQLLCHSVHLLSVTGGWAFNQILKKGGLTGSQFLERCCWGRGGGFFQGAFTVFT